MIEFNTFVRKNYISVKCVVQFIGNFFLYNVFVDKISERFKRISNKQINFAMSVVYFENGDDLKNEGTLIRSTTIRRNL